MKLLENIDAFPLDVALWIFALIFLITMLPKHDKK